MLFKRAKARFMRFFSQKSGFFFQALKLETFFSGLFSGGLFCFMLNQQAQDYRAIFALKFSVPSLGSLRLARSAWKRLNWRLPPPAKPFCYFHCHTDWENLRFSCVGVVCVSSVRIPPCSQILRSKIESGRAASSAWK